MSINQVSEGCKGKCSGCKITKVCTDLQKDKDETETVTLTVAEYRELLKEKDYWQLEAKKWVAELGELKFKIAGLIKEHVGQEESI